METRDIRQQKIVDALNKGRIMEAERLYDELGQQLLPIIGTANQAAIMAVDEAIDRMQDDGLMVQRVKVKALKAQEECRKYERRAYEYFISIGGDRYTFWQDVVGRSAVGLQPDVTRLRYTIKNAIDKDRCQHSDALAYIQTALALVTLSTLQFDCLCEEYQKQTPENITRYFTGWRLTGVSSCWREVGSLTGERWMPRTNLRDNEQCQLGMRVIIGKFKTKEFIELAAKDAVYLNPGTIMKYGSDEDRRLLLDNDDLWEEEQSNINGTK